MDGILLLDEPGGETFSRVPEFRRDQAAFSNKGAFALMGSTLI